MKSRKTLILLVLTVLAVVLCTSCSNQATEEKAKITLSFLNKTGVRVKTISIREEIGKTPQTWSIGGLEVDGHMDMTIDTVLENGQPHVTISFTTQDDYVAQNSFTLKGDKNVTLAKDMKDSYSVRISDK